MIQFLLRMRKSIISSWQHTVQTRYVLLENVTQLVLFLAYRESLCAPFILVTASASLVLTANLTILWELLCMDPQPPQQVMCQLCTTNWHPRQGIQKDCLKGILEGLTGFPNLVPIIYPLGMEVMRERHRKPYPFFMLPPILDPSVIIPSNTLEKLKLYRSLSVLLPLFWDFHQQFLHRVSVSHSRRRRYLLAPLMPTYPLK